VSLCSESESWNVPAGTKSIYQFSPTQVLPIDSAVDIKPNQSDGSILGQVIPNDLVLCGNTSRTFWKVTPMKSSSQALTPTAGMRYPICSVGYYTAGLMSVLEL